MEWRNQDGNCAVKIIQKRVLPWLILVTSVTSFNSSNLRSQIDCVRWNLNSDERKVNTGKTEPRLRHIATHCKPEVWTGPHTLQWRHNGHDRVSNYQPHDCLLNRLFRRRSKKTSKLRVTGLCAGNSPGIGEFPAQMASNAENVSIWWRQHDRKPL